MPFALIGVWRREQYFVASSLFSVFPLPILSFLRPSLSCTLSSIIPLALPFLTSCLNNAWVSIEIHIMRGERVSSRAISPPAVFLHCLYLATACCKYGIIAHNIRCIFVVNDGFFFYSIVFFITLTENIIIIIHTIAWNISMYIFKYSGKKYLLIIGKHFLPIRNMYYINILINEAHTCMKSCIL